MREHTRILIAGIGLVILAGCAATGETVPLDLRARPAASVAHATTSDGLRVVVLPFEDQRQEKHHLGARSHIFGGETYFNVPGGDVGVLVAQIMAEYMRQSGWQAWLAKPGITVPGEEAEVILSGQIQEFHAQARSRFFSTEVTSAVRVAVQGKNVADGSVVRLTMTGASAEPELWFETEDIQNVLNEGVKSSVKKLLANTKIENRKLRTTE